jgi:hypothetical protein
MTKLWYLPYWLVCLILSLPVPAGQMDFRVFRLLTTGMTEAEVLQRAGPPDQVTADVNWVYVPYSPYPQPVELKRLYYYADRASHDPQLTIVSLNGGQVSNLERQHVTSRSLSGHAEPGSTAPDPGPRGAAPGNRSPETAQPDGVLKAARELQEIRERYRRPSASGETPSSAVRRWVDEQGSVHYDDRVPVR